MTTTPFTTYAYKSTGRLTPRTTPDHFAEVFNVMDFGAVGTGTPSPLSGRYGSLAAAQVDYPFVTALTQQIDYAAIQLAINTMWASATKGGTVFLPPGNYLTDTPIDIGNHEIGSNGTNGRIVGSARQSSYINGSINNDFIFYQNSGVNGPNEISNLSLVNGSTWIGSGALRLSTSSLVCKSVLFGGMISVLLPYDIYDASFENCTGGAGNDGTTGYNGTLGIAGYAPHIKNWRSTTNLMAAFQFWGSNGCHIDGCGVENCAVAVLLGVTTGWAGSCTVASNILTVSNPAMPSEHLQFSVGDTLFGRGLALPAWGSDPNSSTGGVTIIDDHNSDPALTGVGYAGTYRISSSYTISTPIPIWSRRSDSISGVTITSFQSEACHHVIYLNNVSGCTIEGAGGGSNPIECTDQFGTTGLTQRCSLFVRSASATKISGYVGAGAATYLGAIVIDPSVNVNTQGCSFDNCYAQKGADNAVTAKIDNGSGSSGNILNVSVFTSGISIGVGMLVTGTGVTAGTRIIANNLLDPTLTGTNTTGTYRVNTSQNVSSRSMTVVTGDDWVMPTKNESKAGVRFSNNSGIIPAGYTSGLNSLAMTFTCLPGQAGWGGYVTLVEGMEYDIVDGQKSGTGTALFGDIVIGGGSQHIKVRYNGTNWTRSG